MSIGKLDEGGSRGECTGLKALLEDVKVEIYSAWGDVLRSMEGNFDMYVIGDEHETPVAPPPQVDLITAGVWVPILTALLTDPAIRMAHLFTGDCVHFSTELFSLGSLCVQSCRESLGSTLCENQYQYLHSYSYRGTF